MIHPSQLTDLSARIQNAFRQRRLPGIYMGQQTRTNMFRWLLRFLILRLPAHKISPLTKICFLYYITGKTIFDNVISIKHIKSFPFKNT